jgi:hypothetical protein
VKSKIAFSLVFIVSLSIFQVANSQEPMERKLCQAVDYALNFEYVDALTLLDSLLQENQEDVRPYLFKAVVYIQFLVNCKNVEKKQNPFLSKYQPS